ncbi:dethiobiotin synthase [Marinicella sediminis]|uniref:ATP-dependent dethiobiotin synthetase BioD n=1 Tax=Marinicella sediminis TaxID=1792834 RepID=A0ABV7JA46_9GAMM|nr:dethiobiotin synthase [Marinicella sediminis]
MLITEFDQLPSCFITATDTDAGKTFVSAEILTAWKQAGFTVGAYKPVASGAIWQKDQWVSEDALALAAVTGQPLDEINPYTFEAPASPHIADTGGVFDLQDCLRRFGDMLNRYDRVLVEGVGGWCVPLSQELMLKDLVLAINLPVVMIARIGLGCINHSLLTIDRIRQDTHLYHGWIANQIDPGFIDARANIQAIIDRS